MHKQVKAGKKAPVRYAAFLRGINNIGSRTVKMNELKRIFEAAGLQRVSTVRASGNIVFETTMPGTGRIIARIEKEAEKVLGQRVTVILRTSGELHSMVRANPFRKFKPTPLTRLFVTFLPEKPAGTLKIPFKSPDNDFIIIRIAGNVIYSVVYLLPGKRPYRIISFLEKNYGNRITNRSWDTILKTVHAANPLQGLNQQKIQ